MSQKMILIADADREVLRELGGAFHQCGYDVRAARNGSQALEKSLMAKPDIVLFEATCPLIPAGKFIKILRSNPETEGIPVIVMHQANSDEASRQNHCEPVIRKPFNTDEVLSLVAATLDRVAMVQQEAPAPQEQPPLLEQEQIDQLQLKLGREPHANHRITRLKVGLLCPDKNFLNEWMSCMGQLPGMEIKGRQEALQQGFGQLGTLRLSETVRLNWILLPLQPVLKPLWHPLGVGMLGGIVLEAGYDQRILLRLHLLAQELAQGKLPLIQLTSRHFWPKKGDRAQATTESATCTARVREAVVELLRQIASKPLDQPSGKKPG